MNRVVAGLHMQYLPLLEPEAVSLFRAFEQSMHRAVGA